MVHQRFERIQQMKDVDKKDHGRRLALSVVFAVN